MVALSLGYVTAHLRGASICLGDMHSPLDSFRFPNFVQVQGQENYPVVETLWVLSVGDLPGVGFPGVDLILPCLTIALTSIQVLPTDDANCRGKIWSPSSNVWDPSLISPIQ